MGTKQTQEASIPLIMECTVEELSEVQLRCLQAAKKAYQDAVKKANRLLAEAAPVSAARPPPPPPPPEPPVTDLTDDDVDRPSPPASPPPPPSPPPAPAAPTPKSPLSLVEDRPSAITNLSSEIPPPARISLRRDLTAAPPTQPVVTLPPSPPPPPPPPPPPQPAPAAPARKANKPAADSGGSSAGSSRPAPRLPRPSETPVGLTPVRSAEEGTSAASEVAGLAADLETRELQTQTYPALHVTVRTPYALTPANKACYAVRRSQLDMRVKKVLLHTASQFTEWLIQTRLVRATQFCPVHPVTWGGQPRQLRLGMFTDSDKLAQSGGYVWVKNCCRPKFQSVHYGSLFDASSLQLPNTLPVQVLKLMYHWACQTPLHNVTQWLKVRPLLVDEVYGLLRAVCMLKVEEPAAKLGGGGRVVQVGLVSLGTSGPDGLNKNVKVEVLGVKDETSGEIRMVGFEPRIKNRIRAVVGAVQDWVHSESSLLLDHSISPLPFRAHFNEVTNAPPASKDNNGNIMHYLRRSMPRMFQTSLVYLQPPVICQFIAEIAWREKYGRDPNTTFTNLITHLGNLTQQCEGSLISMLKKVLVSPSMDLKRKPRKQKLAARPDSQPEFPGEPEAAEVQEVPSGGSSPAPDQASDGGGSEAGSAAAGPSRRRRTGPRLSYGKRSKAARLAAGQQQPADDTRGSFFKLATFADLVMPDLTELRCWECKLPLTHPKHITGIYACRRCRYTTSCEKIYPVHQRVFHSKGVAPVFSMGQPILLEKPMFCRCGYSTDSGNRLALHMSRCECRTARSSPFEVCLEEDSGAARPEGAAAATEDQTPMEVDLEAKQEPEEAVLDL